MKKIIAICLVVALCGCDAISGRQGQEDRKKKFPGLTKKFIIQMSNDKGWSGSNLECDSFSMPNKNTIILWIDNTRSEVRADEIRIFSNTDFINK